MALEGRIENGKVVFDTPVPLPEGTAVRVEPATPESPSGQEPAEQAPRPLSERWRNFARHRVELPEDAARNHDHYLYGTPKR